MVVNQPRSQGCQLVNLIQISIAEIYGVGFSFAQRPQFWTVGKDCLRSGDYCDLLKRTGSNLSQTFSLLYYRGYESDVVGSFEIVT